MVDSRCTATVCGLEHFSDTPVTVGPPMRLRASNGQPLQHYGQKKVELLSDGGEKMHVTFSVHAFLKTFFKHFKPFLTFLLFYTF